MMSADRADQETITKQSRALRAFPLISQLLDSLQTATVVLNPQRQIVAANEALLAILDLDRADQIRGLRPGEALHCVRAEEAEEGCGTSEACTLCGTLEAIVTSQRGEPARAECRLVADRGGNGTTSYDLRMSAAPIEVAGEPYTVFSISDVSHERRRRVLERVFFHDISSTLTELLYFTGQMRNRNRNRDGGPTEDLGAQTHATALRLVEEIESQRTLLAAENHDLRPKSMAVDTRELLKELCNLPLPLETLAGREVVIAPAAEPLTLSSDRALLRRVLVNLTLNGLEACAPGERVTLDAQALDGGVVFTVHNPGVMPRETSLQIFQRSFSTKGSDRGLGTYSVRLLTERYLKGRVSFTSKPGHGTTFASWIPLKLG